MTVNYFCKKLEMACCPAHLNCTAMILTHSDKWAGFPVRYGLRNDRALSA
jgi:hypothetical protein